MLSAALAAMSVGLAALSGLLHGVARVAIEAGFGLLVAAALLVAVRTRADRWRSEWTDEDK